MRTIRIQAYKGKPYKGKYLGRNPMLYKKTVVETLGVENVWGGRGWGLCVDICVPASIPKKEKW